MKLEMNSRLMKLEMNSRLMKLEMNSRLMNLEMDDEQDISDICRVCQRQLMGASVKVTEVGN
jgi:hypothetical protein